MKWYGGEKPIGVTSTLPALVEAFALATDTLKPGKRFFGKNWITCRM